MSGATRYTTPVVILQSARHGGLGIARSLGRLGAPVYGVDATRWEPAFQSRYCRGSFVLDIGSGAGWRSVSGLLDIGRRLGERPILIPTTDKAAIWVAEHAADLQEAFRFQCQDAGLVTLLCDKGRMQELARKAGVPVARSVIPRSKEDVAQFLESATFPVMVKATDAECLRRRTGRTKFLVETPRECFELYAAAEEPGRPNLLIQEFIPGEDWMFNGYFDRSSRCLFGVAGMKIRRFPVKTGVTSLGICLRNEIVEKTTADFMKAIGYHGILDIGYRYDWRDGRYKVLDVNPRVGCTFRLFAGTNGMDVVRALYLDMTGQPVERSQPAHGRKWIVEDFDLYSAFRAYRDGALKLPDWLRSLRGIKETACFALDDPLPLLFTGAWNCRELYRWMCRQRGVRKQRSPADAVVAQAGPHQGNATPAE